jgi:hypothetical protein
MTEEEHTFVKVEVCSVYEELECYFHRAARFCAKVKENNDSL